MLHKSIHMYTHKLYMLIGVSPMCPFLYTERWRQSWRVTPGDTTETKIRKIEDNWAYKGNASSPTSG